MFYKSLIIGNGEVGSSLKRVLDKRDKIRRYFLQRKSCVIDIRDKDFQKKLNNDVCECLHICFPYSKSFIKDCLRYITSFEPILCVIHSSIPVGITEKIHSLIKTPVHIVHSPVRGQHPKLAKSLQTFVKYVGTRDYKAYQLAKKEMSNMKTEWFKDSKTTELGKLLDTSYYGLCISWHREMKRICDHFGISFENAVSDFNKTYNAGYKKLRPNVIRPVLFPPERKIEGHCVVFNAKLLFKQIRSKFLELIK